MVNISMKIPIGEYMEKLINWMTDNFSGVFDSIKGGLEAIINSISWALNAIPIVLFIIIIMLIGWWIAGKGIAIFAGLGLGLIYNLGLWKQTMLTLGLVSAATIIAIIIGLPLGILMAKSNKANKIIRPILDFMQTMPAFVYLIPAVYFFEDRKSVV